MVHADLTGFKAPPKRIAVQEKVVLDPGLVSAEMAGNQWPGFNLRLNVFFWTHLGKPPLAYPVLCPGETILANPTPDAALQFYGVVACYLVALGADLDAPCIDLNGAQLPAPLFRPINHL